MEESPEDDCFKLSFKYFKGKFWNHDFSSLVNYGQNLCGNSNVVPISLNEESSLSSHSSFRKLGLNSVKDWLAYSLKTHPGLIIISNAFNDFGALMWIHDCLKEYSNSSSYRNNISNLSSSPSSSLNGKNWWSNAKEDLLSNESKKNKKRSSVNDLRWATLGYHHNWDTKVYDESRKSPFPRDLNDLCRHILSSSQVADSFEGEAAIVNYYPVGSSLGPHVDHSEYCKHAPILSFSFGASCIFLIGGKDKTKGAPTPLILNHGDILIMSEESRLSYHAVPRILCETPGQAPSLSSFSESVQGLLDLMESYSVNNTSELLLDNLTRGHGCRGVSQEGEVLGGRLHPDFASHFLQRGLDLDDLKAILSYVKERRINVNVRQVNCCH